MTAPALGAISLFFVVPAVASLALSFTDFDIYALANIDNLRFIGFDNYQRLLTNPLFWQAMRNTLWFVVLGVPLIVALSLAAALLVHAKTLRWKPLGGWRCSHVSNDVGATARVDYLLHTLYGR